VSAPAKFSESSWLARVDTLSEHELANYANEAAVKAEGTFAYHAACAGVALLAAKAKVKHGEWAKWLQANFDRSERVAQRYMQLAEDCKRDPHKASALGGGTVRGALSAVGKDQDGHGGSQKPQPNRHRGAETGSPSNPPHGADLPKADPVPDAEWSVTEQKPEPAKRAEFASLEDSPTEKVEEKAQEQGKPITAPDAMTARLLQGQRSEAPKPTPPASPASPAVRPSRAVGERWLSIVRVCIAAIEQAAPSRGAWFESAHAELLSHMRQIEGHCLAFVSEEDETLRGSKTA
jgi:hypothetical protein